MLLVRSFVSIFSVLFVATMAIPDGSAAPTAFAPNEAQVPARGMWSERPAERWQDALVTGNGTLGAMVFGDPASERIVLNHERLYEPLLDQPCPAPNIAGALPEVRRLMLAGKYKEAYAYSYQAAVDAGFPGIQWTDPYHPACALLIEQDDNEEYQNYWRSTNFKTGEIAVRWTAQGRDITRQTFASRPDGVVVQRISAADGQNVTGRLQLKNQDRRNADKRVDEKGGGYHDPEIRVKQGWLSYRCKYNRSPRGYQVLARVIPVGGTVARRPGNRGDTLEFNARELIVLISIQSLEEFDAAAESLATLRHALSQIDADYETLLARHAAIHGELFGRVQLDLGGGHARQLSSEALIAQQKETASETLQPALLEKMFDMGRYTLISSSGEWPPNLMGIWNGEWRPSWSGDFTLDANVNLQIAAANLGNLPEAVESYSRLILGVVEDWKTNSQNLFGSGGVVSGTRTDGRHNLNSHFSQGFPGQFWTAGAEWLVLPMFEHYQTTGDEQYLQNQLLPVMTEIVRFYSDFLSEVDANGKRLFIPSYSPENQPQNTKCPATINATMDIACAKEALRNLLALGVREGITREQREKWQALLAEMPPYLVNADGALQEWAYPGLDDRYDHRHVSHLYPVWPGHEICPEDTPELYQAALVAAERRGRGNGSAHGLAHMALIAARLKNAEWVYGNLRFMLSNDYLLTSLFTFHNPKRIYNADMLHSLPAVVMEMLVYSKSGEIELLPALSDQLPTGIIDGVCCRNQTIVETLRWDLPARIVNVRISSRIDQMVMLRLRRGMEAVTDGDGNRLAVGSEGTVTLKCIPGKPTSLTIKLPD